MQSWRLLQLEPSSLREPDSFTAPVELASDGAHLPATLFHLANASDDETTDSVAIYAEVANRLAQLIDDIRSVYVDRDERRQLLTLYAEGRDGTPYPARALSDGTLRFLALIVLAIDPDSRGVICMEEPENGIHPERIPAMIQLLRDLTRDAQEHQPPDGQYLRQVIINTHSPSVVMQVPDDSLVMAEAVEVTRNQISFKALQLRGLANTWRDKTTSLGPISRGRLLAYLNPVARNGENGESNSGHPRRVIDREDVRQYSIPFNEISE
jgi:predicted ATPase